MNPGELAPGVVTALCCAGLGVSLVVHAVWWRFAAVALIDHVREHHPVAWRAAGGPLSPDAPPPGGRRAAVERRMVAARSAWRWMRRAPGGADDCPDLPALRRGARLACGSFVTSSVVLLVIERILG